MYEIGDLFDKRSVVCARLEEILSERGYSKTKFCKMCDISRPTLDKLLSGTLTSKTNFEKHLSKILNALTLTPDMLLGGSRNIYMRMREIRAIFRMKEEDIAEATSITLERLKSIESGCSATQAELRDIAAYLGTSTSCIDGTGFFHPQFSGPEWFPEPCSGEGNRDIISGFWGHLGIQPVHSDTFLWFPITKHTCDMLCEQKELPRLIIPCMNNKLLYINPRHINNIVLLDDACAAPGFANWDPAIGKGEIPPVVFEMLEDYLYYSDCGQAPPADEISPALFGSLKDLVSRRKWTEDDIAEMTQKILIRYSDGGMIVNNIDFDASEIIDEIELICMYGESSGDEKYVSFRDYNGAITFINTENISVIELPLVQTEAAICRNQLEDLEECGNMEPALNVKLDSVDHE